MKDEKIKVALVDDHAMFREGLVNLLKDYDEIEVLFSVRSGVEMQERMNAGQVPEVLLMDIHMPEMDGHEATRWVQAHFEQVRILALSMDEEDAAISRMVGNGAGGYILKQSNTGEVVKGIKAIATQGFFINEMLTGRLMHTLREGTGDKKVRITGREMEFLKLCCSEYTYKEIADLMGVSPRTVDNYREDLFEKLDLKSRQGLVIYAIKNGLSTV